MLKVFEKLLKIQYENKIYNNWKILSYLGIKNLDIGYNYFFICQCQKCGLKEDHSIYEIVRSEGCNHG